MDTKWGRRVLAKVGPAALAVVLASWPVVAFQADAADTPWPGELMGMSVEQVKQVDEKIEIVTTGAKFDVDLEHNRIQCTQRIPLPRKVASILLDLNLADTAVSQRGRGVVNLAARDGSFSIEFSGDSVMRIRSQKPYLLEAELAIEPVRTAAAEEGRVYHAAGGFGIIPQPAGALKPSITAAGWTAQVAADVRIYAFVFPPRPFPWKQSFHDRVIHNCSHRHPYPTQEELKSYLPLGNVLTLHSWIWRGKYGADYTQEFDDSWLAAPPVAKGSQRFKQTVADAHRLGMKVVAYISPYYVGQNQKGKEGNVEYFLQQQDRVLKEFNLDGVYYDGVYLDGADCVERSYELLKRSRSMLGPEGVLYLHETTSPLRCVIPFVDAYADFIVRGEHEGWNPEVSCYNVSNSIGLYWYDDGRITQELIRNTLRSNSRLHALVGDGTWRGRNLFLGAEELQLYRESYLKELERMEQIGYDAYLRSTKSRNDGRPKSP